MFAFNHPVITARISSDAEVAEFRIRNIPKPIINLVSKHGIKRLSPKNYSTTTTAPF